MENLRLLLVDSTAVQTLYKTLLHLAASLAASPTLILDITDIQNHGAAYVVVSHLKKKKLKR